MLSNIIEPILIYFYFMKKFLLILSAISLIWISGCKDDDRSGSFVGVWIGTTVAVTDCMEPTDNSERSLSCDDSSCYRLDLNGDGTYTYQEGLAITPGTWSTAGGITLCSVEDGEEVCETYAAVVNSTTLTLSTTNEDTGCITSLIFTRTEEAMDDESDGQ